MGRPPLRAHQIVGTGLLDLHTLRRLALAARSLSLNSLLYPLSRAWPMGFSWSSLVDAMLEVCTRGGLRKDSQLADDLPAPSKDLAWAPAIDDIVVLSSRTPRGDAEHYETH